MARSIFSPSQNPHPTELELRYLLRHLQHDFMSDLIEARAGLELVLNDKFLEAEGKKKDYLKDTLVHVGHTQSIAYAVATMENKPRHHAEFEFTSLASRLVNTNNVKYRKGSKLIVTASEYLTIDNFQSVLYMQLFNFVQNAQKTHRAAGKSHTQIQLKAQAESLTPDHLEYLGKHQERYTSSDQFVCISVIDQGEGIPPEKISTIFSPKTDLTQGVGLALVDYVCDILHGFIIVESEVNSGSNFSLYIPQNNKN